MKYADIINNLKKMGLHRAAEAIQPKLKRDFKKMKEKQKEKNK